MYVVPERRGGGEGDAVVAEVILEALEIVAREKEWRVLRAQTSKAMGQAMRFYKKHGYVQGEIFGWYKVNEHFVYHVKTLD